MLSFALEYCEPALLEDNSCCFSGLLRQYVSHVPSTCPTSEPSAAPSRVIEAHRQGTASKHPPQQITCATCQLASAGKSQGLYNTTTDTPHIVSPRRRAVKGRAGGHDVCKFCLNGFTKHSKTHKKATQICICCNAKLSCPWRWTQSLPSQGPRKWLLPCTKLYHNWV